MKISKEAERFCGSCDSHNCYDYPSKVFCSTRYAKGKDPIVDTLWNCNEYNQVSQECYCVHEAQRARTLRQVSIRTMKDIRRRRFFE